jgi:hypothetical protein
MAGLEQHGQHLEAMRHSANGGSLERRPLRIFQNRVGCCGRSAFRGPAAATAIRTLALDGDCRSSIAMLLTAAMDGNYPRTGGVPTHRAQTCKP